MPKYYEHHDLHPRIAHWLDIRGLLYIHEYRACGGQIDFVSIQPSTGYVSIIEAKIQVMHWDDAQVNHYHKVFGIPDAGKLLFSLLPVDEEHISILENNGIEVVELNMDMPASKIRNLNDTAWPFAEIFEETYGKPLEGKSPLIKYLHRTFYGDSE